jgi:hypothetical protein
LSKGSRQILHSEPGGAYEALPEVREMTLFDRKEVDGCARRTWGRTKRDGKGRGTRTGRGNK